MKKQIIIFALLGLLLGACTEPDSATTSDRSAGPPTPTREGTWTSVIDGYIYNFDAQAEPIPGATVRYELVLSYFPEIQDGHENQTETDRQGEFTLPVIMHDTDKMRVVVEAAGYQPYEESFVGIDLVEGKTLTVGLLPTASTAP
ncbi:MAG: carboxypeptidase regulatory-like domain-containing protein [Anaerolineales bacterium]|nr:carboxypeptidase regulatory-like domain-containing protein [Anaerolineales bacterium]